MGPPSGAAAQHGHGRPTMIAAALRALPPPAAAAARARDRSRPHEPRADARRERAGRSVRAGRREEGRRGLRLVPGGAAGALGSAAPRRLAGPPAGPRSFGSAGNRARPRAARPRRRRRPSGRPRRCLPPGPPPLSRPAAPGPAAAPPLRAPARRFPPAPLRPNFSVPAATCCPRALRDQGRAGGRAAVGGRRRAGRSPPAGRNLWVSLRRTFFCLRSLSTTFAAPAPYPSAQSAAAALTPAVPGGRGREGGREGAPRTAPTAAGEGGFRARPGVGAVCSAAPHGQEHEALRGYPSRRAASRTSERRW